MTDGQFRLPGRMDVALTGDVNNWAPTGIGTSTSIYIDPDNNWSITGIDAAAYSTGGNALERVLVLHNEDTTFTVSLVGLSGSSSAANQFAWSGTISLGRGESVVLKYDRSALLWRLVALGKVPSTGVSAGGSNTQVQYNNSGSLGGDADLTWDATNNQLTSTNVRCSGVFNLTGDVAVTVSTSPQNDWAPTGLAAGGILRVNPDTAAVSITGIAAPSSPFNDGRVLIVYNVGTGGFALNIINESASSTAANRFSLDSNFAINQGQGAVFTYDSTSSRWRCCGMMGPTSHTHVSSVTGGTLDAAAIASGTIATARLGSGTATAYTGLLGDQSWGDVTRAILREVTLIDLNTSTTETDIFNSTVPANVMESNRMLRLNLDCDVLNNSGGAETARTLRVYVGGTLRFQDTMTLVANGATRQPLNIVVNIGMQNATNTMHMWGVVIMGAGATAPNTGLGDTATDETLVTAAISSNGTFTQDSTATFAVRVTMQHGTNNANVSTRRQYACLEVV